MNAPSPDMADHASQTGSHLLDPIGGYDGDPAIDDRRVGYRRVQLCSVFMAMDGVAEAGLNAVRDVMLLWLWIAIVTVAATIFWIASKRAQQRLISSDPPTSSRLVESFVIFALLMSNAANYIGAIASGGQRIPFGYPMVFLAFATLFSIPTRRFVLIAGVTYAVYATWIVSLDVPVMGKISPLMNGTLAVIVGCFGRAGIERIQQIGVEQRRRIVMQNRALGEANQTLLQRNVELNDLMAIAAHDLRSPLFGLRGVLDLARDRPPVSPQGWDRLLDAASRSVIAMVELVTRLLDVHEAEARTELPLKMKNLNSLLAAALQRMAPLAEIAGVRIETTGPQIAARIIGHGESVGQILDNFIGNAIRFSPRGSLIEVAIHASATQVRLDVADRGVGVPDGERDMLFTKFRRGAISPLNGLRGSGLGLYIARMLAYQMLARCTYEPRPGGGSIFSILFQPAERFIDNTPSLNT